MAYDKPSTIESPPEPKPAKSLPPDPPAKQGSGIVRWLVRLVWLAVIVAAAWFGYRSYQSRARTGTEVTATNTKGGGRGGPGGRPTPISAVPARVHDIPVYLRGLGSVAAFNTVSVKSRVDGQLIAIHFTEGQFVKAGDLLAEIDPRPFQVQLEQAQGQLARDQAQLKDAQTNLQRYEALWKDQVIARAQLDTQRAQVGQFTGVIEADQGAINSAKLNLIYARITAPIGGRVGLRQVDAGNIVHAADANGIVSIAQLEPIAVLFTIPADNLPEVLKKLRAGVKLRVDAYDRDDTDKIASGTLLTVDNTIDPTTGTSKLKAVFNNKDGALFPMQFVNCRLLIDTQHNAVTVPAPAIQRGPQGSFVYVVEGNKAKVTQVETGITEASDVVIDQGLKGGEMVVVDGADKLQDGATVEVRQPGPGGGAGRGGRGGPRQ
jgi:membrane fusion protein, multidrug efflux system